MKMKWQAAILFAGILTGCSTSEEKKEISATEVPVIQLHQTDTSLNRNYVADIQAVKNVEIRARVNGYLENIYVDEGRSVRKGQLLFRISNQEFTNALMKAKASLASAKATAKIATLEMERIKVLVDKNVIVKSELDLAKARVEDAQAKVNEAIAEVADAKTKISYLSVRSPFNGTIDRIPMKIGSMVSDGTLLTTISDNNEMYAYFNVSENEYLESKKETSGKLKENTMASLVLSDGTLYPYKGKIETQEAEFSDNTGSIAFRARFPNPEHMLRHGASGKIQLVSHLNSKLLVPQKAVLEIQDKSFVFVVNPENKVKMQTFIPELRISEYYVVYSGLNAGDKIVYEGVQNIKDGVEIKPRIVGPKKLIAAKVK